MMFRHVADLVPGDAVRPFDDRLWHVHSIGAPDYRGRDNVHQSGGRVAVTFSHPVDGAIEVVCCLNDTVRLG